MIGSAIVRSTRIRNHSALVINNMLSYQVNHYMINGLIIDDIGDYLFYIS